MVSGVCYSKDHTINLQYSDNFTLHSNFSNTGMCKVPINCVKYQFFTHNTSTRYCLYATCSIYLKAAVMVIASPLTEPSLSNVTELLTNMNDAAIHITIHTRMTSTIMISMIQTAGVL